MQTHGYKPQCYGLVLQDQGQDETSASLWFHRDVSGHLRSKSVALFIIQCLKPSQHPLTLHVTWDGMMEMGKIPRVPLGGGIHWISVNGCKACEAKLSVAITLTMSVPVKSLTVFEVSVFQCYCCCLMMGILKWLDKYEM